MPANLTPEYMQAEERFKQARTSEEKIAALEGMLSAIPKHKGTEKMQADIKRRLKKARGEARKKGGAKQAQPVSYVAREGAGQVALVGPPNGGKSSLLARLTRAAPLVADYPFSTRRPLPGMMAFENIQIQLIDLPPLHPDSPDAPWVPQTVRIADAAVLVVGLDEPAVLEQLTEVLALLERGKVRLGRDDGAELPRGFVRKPALLLGNKLEAAGARDAFETLAELWGERFPLLAVSLAAGEGLEAFRRAVYDLLGIVRVYSKAPGKKPDLGSPFVVPRGATVREVAERVHKDFAAGLKFARLWGGSKYDGQRVHNDHVVADNDVLELHL